MRRSRRIQQTSAGKYLALVLLCVFTTAAATAHHPQPAQDGPERAHAGTLQAVAFSQRIKWLTPGDNRPDFGDHPEPAAVPPALRLQLPATFEALNPRALPAHAFEALYALPVTRAPPRY